MLDDFLANVNVEKLPNLQLVDVVFLPPRRLPVYSLWSLELQPSCDVIEREKLDVLIIFVYGYYRYLQSDQLRAMNWIRETWDKLDGEILHICWRATGLLDDDKHFEDYTQDPEGTKVMELSTDVLSARQRICIERLLKPSCEEDCRRVTGTRITSRGQMLVDIGNRYIVAT